MYKVYALNDLKQIARWGIRNKNKKQNTKKSSKNHSKSIRSQNCKKLLLRTHSDYHDIGVL
jgi:hypothetical protein